MGAASRAQQRRRLLLHTKPRRGVLAGLGCAVLQQYFSSACSGTEAGRSLVRSRRALHAVGDACTKPHPLPKAAPPARTELHGSQCIAQGGRG